MKKLALTMLFISTPLWAAAHALTPAQEARVQQLVEETLVNNPQILARASQAYEKKLREQQQEQIAQIIKKNHSTLFQDPASPRLGAADAKLTLVTFTDYNCRYCKQFDKLLEKLVAENPEVAVVIKPLPFRAESSATAARAVLALWPAESKKSLALHKKLMAHHGMLDNNSISAAEKALDVKAAETDSAAQKTLDTNLKMAQQLGIQGTPATLAGDNVLSGMVPYQQLGTIVKQQLAEMSLLFRA